MSGIAEWLAGLGLEQYTDVFLEHDIDLDILPELSDDDLISIGVSLGHRKKILRAAKTFLPTDKSPELRTAAPGEKQHDNVYEQGERRHLTVVFADLVGSTKLSSELDPEDYTSVIRAYHDVCAKAIAGYDGYVAQYLGDGVLAYFGYPRAHEDDAERAIRAAREIIAAVSTLTPFAGLTLHSRIGIATGAVVVGDIIGPGTNTEISAAGETPNLAARLQALAPPDGIVISSNTRRLVEGRFTFQDLGPQTLKGFSHALHAFVVGEQTEAYERYESQSAQGPSQLVGRDEEIGLFMRRWHLAKEGDGQVILLSAEAGVGKSRVLRALQDQIKDEPFSEVLYFGSPFHQNSALYPAADQLRRSLCLGKDDNEDSVLACLQEMLQRVAIPPAECLPYLASLLGIDVAKRFGLPDLLAQELRARTLETIISVIENISKQTPVLMVVEDAHWIDPSTLELLDTLINSLRDERVLLVIAYRPEFEAPWGREGHVTTCTLNHLSRKESAGLVQLVAGNKSLPEELIAQIVSRTDGVPLFIEELTKSILESGGLRDTENGYELQDTLSSLSIPDSLHDSLMARLDRLSSAKEVAQTGAVIGREFSYDLLSQVTLEDVEKLDAALDVLVDSGLVFRHGHIPDAIFEFKHALVRDVSYETLLKKNRRHIHERIARTLEQRAADQGNIPLELIAQHFEGAEDADAAIEYWYRAGQRAAERSAYHEAIAHCERGLKLLDSLSSAESNKQWELDLQLVIGVSSLPIHGFSSPIAIAAYHRARDLAKELDVPARLFAATWGVWMYQQQAGQIESAQKMANELIRLSEQLGDTEYRLEAHHAAWATCYRMGDFANCLQHAEQGLALHDPDEHAGLANRYSGHDAGVCARNHAALSSWFLGRPDQAVAHDQTCAALVDRIKHPFSTVHAKWFSSMLCRHLGDPKSAYRCTEDALKVSRKLGYPQLTGYTEVIHGWAVAQLQNEDDGIAIINKGLEKLTRIGAWARCGTFLPCLIEIHMISKDHEKALAAVERTLDLIRRSGERTSETEVLVLKGEILAQAGAPLPEIEAALQAALELARRDGVRAMELRAMTALARLWGDTKRRQEGVELLQKIYSSYSEGLTTRDVLAARQVLNELTTGT